LDDDGIERESQYHVDRLKPWVEEHGKFGGLLQGVLQDHYSMLSSIYHVFLNIYALYKTYAVEDALANSLTDPFRVIWLLYSMVFAVAVWHQFLLLGGTFASRVFDVVHPFIAMEFCRDEDGGLAKPCTMKSVTNLIAFLICTVLRGIAACIALAGTSVELVWRCATGNVFFHTARYSKSHLVITASLVVPATAFLIYFGNLGFLYGCCAARIGCFIGNTTSPPHNYYGCGSTNWDYPIQYINGDPSQGSNGNTCLLSKCNTGPIKFNTDLKQQIFLTLQPLLMAFGKWITAKVKKEDDGLEVSHYSPFYGCGRVRPGACQFPACKVADSAGLLGFSIRGFLILVVCNMGWLLAIRSDSG
jgi:hypothetical protein